MIGSIPKITGIKALDYQIMERDQRIGNICNRCKAVYEQGYNPGQFIEEICNEEGVDINSLTNDEVRKINNSCR